MINGCALARQADSERCAHIDFTADLNLASVFLTMLYDSDSPNPGPLSIGLSQCELPPRLC